jgi:hypothetical protein
MERRRWFSVLRGRVSKQFTNGSKTAVMTYRFSICLLGSSTIQLRDSLGSRRACACSEAGFSSQNGGRRAAFCWALLWVKDPMRRIFIKKYFLFTVGKGLSHKAVRSWLANFCWWLRGWNGIAELAETTVKEDFYAAGFDALVKRWNKCINVGGAYAET